MGDQAQDLKRKFVEDELPTLQFTAIEPAPKKPKHPQPLSRIAERKFWSLPVELKDMVSANVMSLLFAQITSTDFAQLTKSDLRDRLEIASLLRHRNGSSANTPDIADYFLRILYRDMEFCLDPDSVVLLKGLIEHPAVYKFSLIKNVLFDAYVETSEDGLEKLLRKFPRSSPNLRIASFTMESTIGLETLPVLQQFYQYNSPSLEVIVVPTWNDGNTENVLTLYHNVAATKNLTEPWTLLETRTAAQIKQINYHNRLATPDGLSHDDDNHQPHILQQTGLLNLHTSLTRERKAPRDAPSHHSEQLDVMAHWNVPVCLYRSLVAETNGYKVRGFSILANSYTGHPPLGPVVGGMGWAKTIALEELRLSFVDCAAYGQGLLSSEPEEVPKTLSFGSLKLLQLNGCIGNAKLLNGLRKQSADIKTFVFSVHNYDITTDEEEAIVQFVRSSSNLRSLSLFYKSPSAEPSRPHAAFDVLKDYPEASDFEPTDDGNARNAQRQGAEASENVQAPEAQTTTWVPEFDRFPLRRLFSSVNYTIRSLALTQNHRSQLSIDDLAYIGRACPHLTELAITCPLIEWAVIDDVIDADLKLHLQELADVLRTFPNLKYLQLIARGDGRDIYYESSHLEGITRQVISLLAGYGLRIDYFTVALRCTFHTYEKGAEDCHLRVRSDPDLCETIGEKALKRDMEVFGDTMPCIFEHLVTRKTGFVYDYYER
jgi:hypothetical protein